ncbi:hypothetical protein ABKV19_023389 [Rosa sericea]
MNQIPQPRSVNFLSVLQERYKPRPMRAERGNELHNGKLIVQNWGFRSWPDGIQSMAIPLRTDKASMLDEAVEYLKQLQLQVQGRKEETEEGGDGKDRRGREIQKTRRTALLHRFKDMSAGTRNNFENKFWAKSQDSGSIHSFYDVGANPLDKQVSISKSDKRRRLMLEGCDLLGGWSTIMP